VEQTSEESWVPVVSAKRLACWVHFVDPRYGVTLEGFHVSPGRERRIPLAARQRNTSHPPKGEVRALNATFSVHYPRN
jgi:beta-mannosidase